VWLDRLAIGKWNESRVVVGGGPTVSIHHYELKAAYVNINQCSMGISLSHLCLYDCPCLILFVPVIFFDCDFWQYLFKLKVEFAPVH